MKTMRRVRSIPPIAVLLALLVTVPAAGFAATDAEIGLSLIHISEPTRPY